MKKTSNKILAGFFLLVLLVPIVLLMAFKSKFKEGNFTVVKSGIFEGDDFRSGTFKAYKVIKLIAPPGRILKCNLQYSDSLYYGYNKTATGDSIMIYNEADTVFVKYSNLKAMEQENSEIYLNLKLPAIENLVIGNAEVTIDSVNARENKDIVVEVNGTGLLNIGRVTEQRNAPDNISHDFPFDINQLSLKMNGGEVTLGNKVNIQRLNMQVDGAAVLSINDGTTIGELQGAVSEESSVKANWKHVKRLVALTK